MTIQAARFLGNQSVSIQEWPLPVVAPGEVLLRVRRTALCGSDIKLWNKGSTWIPGHEIFGVVDQPGHALHGKRCLVFIPVHCGHCTSCLAGDTHLCETDSVLVGWNRHGGYGEALSVPEQCLLPVPDDISDDLAPLLLDTIGTSAHGIRMAKPLVPAACPVLVMGAGPIGLGAILALQDMGFTDISVSDPRASRLELAMEFGAKAHAIDDMATRFSFVLECSGAHVARNRALHIVRPHGVVLLLGENDNPWTIEETKPIRRKDFIMMRSFYFPKSDFAQNIELLRRHRPLYARLKGQVFPLAELPQMFARFAAGELIKPLLSVGRDSAL
ncbi:MAG: alcohol dehydrogenase [Betaproteobacteria bacterium]|nr:alcohol dehydrogenase [Betaproteobacteria bacterium]